MKPTAYRHSSHADLPVDSDWREIQLLDRCEAAEAEAGRLRAELERLRTELLVARLWVKELALWIDDPPGPMAETGSRGAETTALLETRSTAPVPWGRLAVVGVSILVPWLVLGLIALAVYRLI